MYPTYVHLWNVTAVCAVNLHPRIDEHQVRFPELGHAHEHHPRLAESRTRPQQKFRM